MTKQATHAYRLAAALLLAVSVPASAQTSSLYLRPAGGQADPTSDSRMHPAVSRLGYAVVPRPEPRTFALHDLVTILVREDFQSGADATLETEKGIAWQGGIEAFPQLSLNDFFDIRLRPNVFANGTVELDVNLDNEFEGEGEANRRDYMTGRITARIIDVKPNGTLVLEARKHLQNDEEAVTIAATGLCRAEDVSPADNTILSSAIYDLHIVKATDGELRRATDKGLLTQLMELVFDY